MSRILAPLSNPSDEMQHLDVLRFVASLAVVVYHFQQLLDPSPVVDLWLHTVGELNFAVDLFFLLSGYVISRFYSGVHSLAEYGSFMWKRIARLYPLHFATLMIFVAMGVGGHFFNLHFKHPEQFDLNCLPQNLLLLHSLHLCDYLTFNQPSWSISAEFLLYFLLPAFIAIRRARMLAITAVILGYAMLYLAAPDGSPMPWYTWTYHFSILRAAPSFLLGSLCYDFRKLIVRIPLAGEPVMWILLLGIFCFGHPVPPMLQAFLLFLAAICAIAADQRRSFSRAVRKLAPLGALTYSMYLIHPVVDAVAINFLGKKMMGLSGGTINLFILICIPVTMVLAYLSFSLFENPARRWLTRLVIRRHTGVRPADLRTPL